MSTLDVNTTSSSDDFKTDMDKYGLALVSNILSDKDPELFRFVIGQEISEFLKKCSSNDSCITFASPYSDDLNDREIEHFLPSYYYRSSNPIKLPSLSNASDDTLFFTFYVLVCDVLQCHIASELYSRGWQYAHNLQKWVNRDHHGVPLIFDTMRWTVRPYDINESDGNLDSYQFLSESYVQDSVQRALSSIMVEHPYSVNISQQQQSQILMSPMKDNIRNLTTQSKAELQRISAVPNQNNTMQQPPMANPTSLPSMHMINQPIMNLPSHLPSRPTNAPSLPPFGHPPPQDAPLYSQQQQPTQQAPTQMSHFTPPQQQQHQQVMTMRSNAQQHPQQQPAPMSKLQASMFQPAGQPQSILQHQQQPTPSNPQMDMYRLQQQQQHQQNPQASYTPLVGMNQRIMNPTSHSSATPSMHPAQHQQQGVAPSQQSQQPLVRPGGNPWS